MLINNVYLLTLENEGSSQLARETSRPMIKIGG